MIFFHVTEANNKSSYCWIFILASFSGITKPVAEEHENQYSRLYSLKGNEDVEIWYQKFCQNLLQTQTS